ncbi:MAG TPA: outer membrane beta-barrel protein [Bryobacteraceae bacterium]|nr:outer membrane beta-barrel protein [Bryobacteraceae bacterium]
MRRAMFILLFLACTGAAFAQLGEFSVSAGSSKMRNNALGTGDFSDFKATSNFRLGFRFTINSWRFLGHEIGYAYNRGKLEGPGFEYGMPVHQGMYNFLAYATPEGARIRPFATGGVHFSTYYPPGSSVYNGNGSTKFGYNYGAGIKVRLTSLFMGRVDIRDYTNGKPDFGINPDGKLHQLEVSAGLGIAF